MRLTLEIIKGFHCDPEGPPQHPWTEDSATARKRSQNFSTSVWHDSSINWPHRLKVWLAHLLSEYFLNEQINDVSSSAPPFLLHKNKHIETIYICINLLTHTYTDIYMPTNPSPYGHTHREMNFDINTHTGTHVHTQMYTHTQRYLPLKFLCPNSWLIHGFMTLSVTLGPGALWWQFDNVIIVYLTV